MNQFDDSMIFFDFMMSGAILHVETRIKEIRDQIGKTEEERKTKGGGFGRPNYDKIIMDLKESLLQCYINLATLQRHRADLAETSLGVMLPGAMSGLPYSVRPVPVLDTPVNKRSRTSAFGGFGDDSS